MFRSIRLKNIRITLFSFCCLALFVAVCMLALRAGAPDTVMIGGKSCSLRAEDDSDISAFLSACGYDDARLRTETEVVIPKHWNEVYIRYQELQKQQGFDLVLYKGKTATEQVYAVDDDDCLTLLISGSRIIGGHICGIDGGDIRPLIIDE